MMRPLAYKLRHFLARLAVADLPRRSTSACGAKTTLRRHADRVKMQIQMMDQMMDAGEEQIKSPNPMTAPSAMLSKLKSLSGASPAGMQRQPRDGRAAVIAPRPAPTKIAASRLTSHATHQGANPPNT